jgi:hypothetical protein
MSEKCGIVFDSGQIKLDIKYKQPKTYIIYYGQLQYSGVSDYSIYDFIIASDTSSVDEVNKCRVDGCKVFQYKAFGSVFEDSESWLDTFKGVIKTWFDSGLCDGIFLDECEVGYWDLSYYTDKIKIDIFQKSLENICDYCVNLGIEVVVNGVRGLSQCGDYWLWESFGGYWSTNHIDFTGSGSGTRTVAANGTIGYALNLSAWTLNGSCTLSDGKIIDGSSGYIQYDFDMDTILETGDELDSYDFVYFEWFGSGANDSTCEIYAWYGNTWPFDGSWVAMPKLYSGSPAVWNGINISAKYIRIKMIFSGANDLSIDSLHLFYGYVYPYYDMTASNGDADTNIQAWNYNEAQLNYILNLKNLWENDMTKNRALRVLCHCYGLFSDTSKVEYMFVLSKIFDFYSWDFTHPLHQFIEYTDILDDPFGMRLSYSNDGDGDYSATFTGCTASIDVKNNTYVLTRTEPGYWYDRAIACDGDMSDWSAIAKAYENTNSATLDIYLREITQDFASGSFDNVYIHGDGYLTLINTAIDGTWTSAEITATGSRLSKLDSILFGIAGSVTIEIRYKDKNDSWGSYNTYTYNESSIDEEFKALQIKLTFAAGGWVTCWAYSLYYKIELLEPLNLREIKIADDNSYLYIYAKFNDVIDFDTHLYNLYFYTEDTADFGFIGDWWETSYGVHFYIYNTSLYRWDDNTDRTDTAGFTYLGHIFSYEFSADGKEIEYKIKKSIFKRIPVQEIKVYMLLLEATTNYTALIQESGVNTSVTPVAFDGEMLYTQTEYNNYSPHGYYRSEEIFLGTNYGFKIEFDKTTPTDTSAKMYLRYRDKNGWSAWAEVEDGYTYSKTVKALQYCACLYTTDKTATPIIENIGITCL